ncbi:MAG: hypothetical protein M1118_06045, partial [Chloroflexi bacterium]|nr:hypothetical protein [Chloroflexota bacterium]
MSPDLQQTRRQVLRALLGLGGAAAVVSLAACGTTPPGVTAGTSSSSAASTTAVKASTSAAAPKTSAASSSAATSTSSAAAAAATPTATPVPVRQAAAGRKYTIQVWHPFGGNRVEDLFKLADGFEKTHPDV